VKNSLAFFLLYFIISTLQLSSQQRVLDSLQLLISADKEDTNKVIHLLAVTSVYFRSSPSKALEYSEKALKAAIQIDWTKGRANAYYNIGYAHYQLGDFFETQNSWKKSLQIFELLNNKKERAKLVGALGALYISQNNYPVALEYCLKALKLCGELGDKSGMPYHLGNIAIVYQWQGENTKAIEYYKRALKLYNELGNKRGVAEQFGNLGSVSMLQKDNKQALDYYLKALQMFEEIDDEPHIADVTGAIGAIYNELAIYSNAGPGERAELLDKALKCHFNALKLNEGLGMKAATSLNLFNIATVFYHQKKLKEVEHYLSKAMVIAEAAGVLESQKNIFEGLSFLYMDRGDHKRSLEYYKKYIAIKDSIFNEEKNRELTKHELNYEFEKKEAATRAEQEKKDAVTNTEGKKQKAVLILVSCVLALVFVFAGFIFRSLRITSKQKLLIETKNEQTEFQKKVIEEKNKDILDSIHYAKRIQTSLMPSEKMLQRNLNRMKKI